MLFLFLVFFFFFFNDTATTEIYTLSLHDALTISVLGPGGGRRRWAVPAAAGVVLLTRPWTGGIDPAGLGFALGAAACWGGYILLTQHVGDRVTGLRGLAVSMPVAG